MRSIGIVMFMALVSYMIFGGKYFLALEGKEHLTRKDKIIGYGAMVTIATLPIWSYLLFKMMGL